MEKVAVYGAGYVGLPLIILLSQKGYAVTGVDTNAEKIALLKKGISPIKDERISRSLPAAAKDVQWTTDGVAAAGANSILIVCVPTPVTSDHKPDLAPLESSCAAISKGLQQGSLVIIESTISPGTCEEFVLPILRRSGLSETDFCLAHCPERVDPGNAAYPLEKINRVIGATTAGGLQRAAAFYQSFISAQITPLRSIKAAEAAKIIENAFRDVNIAFVNELAMSFDKLGIDILEVIRGASTKPFAFLPHYPGCGVGGHCIAVDPYYLIDRAQKENFNHRFLKLAREINNSMPHYTIRRLQEALQQLGKKITDVDIAVLGLAYKGNIDDMRESPALEIIRELRQLHARVKVYDPFLPERSDVQSLDDALQADVLLIATAHAEFQSIPDRLSSLPRIRIIIDGRNCLPRERIPQSIIYRGIGR
ncbi:MAG TPA: nucleotide sugar dehydrogenase [Candidatus Nanoarchaeia archaeon]|nr:nucleotide sugar dehydrogenase [Candidatus Nanoarchaeia archaeon]